MKKNFAYSAEFDEETEKLFREAKYLGQGNNGIVYEIPNNKIIKIFLNQKVCDDEGYILIKTSKSNYFPKFYKKGKLYIIRDLVEGERLDDYIKKNGLNEKLVRNIYDLLREFRNLKFSKLDIRCKDIFISNNLKLMIIDPKKFYKRKVDYPRHLMKGLKRIGVLEKFLEEMRVIDKRKAELWEKKFLCYSENDNKLFP